MGRRPTTGVSQILGAPSPINDAQALSPVSTLDSYNNNLLADPQVARAAGSETADRVMSYCIQGTLDVFAGIPIAGCVAGPRAVTG